VPVVSNPPEQRLWTANQRVVGDAALASLGDAGYDMGARARQIRDDLRARAAFVPADMLEIQLDDRALMLERWKDLLKPDYKGMVGYLDPTSAAVGYVGAVAINLALGGSPKNFDPAINFFKDLHKNDPIVPKQTSYARVVSGEMPILFDYDFNAYRAKYSEKGNFEFVIPCEGSVVYPYVIGLVKNAPDKDKAKKVIDYLLSDKGQAIWTNAYLRPARPIDLPEAVKKKFLPDSDYARAKNVDWGQMENVQKGFVDRYLAEVR